MLRVRLGTFRFENSGYMAVVMCLLVTVRKIGVPFGPNAFEPSCGFAVVVVAV